VAKIGELAHKVRAKHTRQIQKMVCSSAPGKYYKNSFEVVMERIATTAA
jgi:hypothetical protein